MRTYRLSYENHTGDMKEVVVQCNEMKTVYNHIKKEIPDLIRVVMVEKINFEKSIDLSKYE